MEWVAPVPGRDGDQAAAPPSALVHAGGHLLLVGRDVYAIDPATGDGDLVFESGTTSDIAVFALSAVPMADLSAPA